MNRARPGQIIGYRTSGAPIRLIGGAADDDDDDGDGLGDLIGDNPDGAGDGDGTGDGDSGDNGSGSAPPAWWGPASTQLQSTIQQRVNSEIDRRINTLVNRRRNNNQGNGQGDGQQGDGQQQNHRAGISGVDPGDVRDARAVAREAITDSGLRLTAEERELLSDYLAGSIVTGLTRDPDPDVIGTQVAAQFIGRVKKLRGSYQKRVVSRLAAQGVLDKEKLKPGQRQSAGGSQQDRQTGASFEGGMAKAHELLQRRGYTIPGQQQTSTTRN